jgi:membrane protein DedA with SNARE-associated domain
VSFDIVDFATHYGYLAVFTGVGAEGVGIPLPGETVLVVAAVLAGSGRLNLVAVGAVAWAAAVVCPQLGYFVGLRWGTRLLDWGPIARMYPPAHVARAQAFFSRLGWVAVLVGRFVAVMRIFAAPLAGMHRMPWWRYTVANAVGSLLWVGAICGIGALIGGNLPRAEHLVATVGLVGAVVFVVLCVAGIGLVMVRRRRRAHAVAPADSPTPPA